MPVLLVGSALFSGSETALFSLSAHQQSLMAKSSRPGLSAASALVSDTRALLVTLLIGNMVINVLYFTLSTLLIDRLLSDGLITKPGAAGIALATFFGVIIFGEVLPKQIAAQRAYAWSGLVGVPLLATHRLIAPLRIVAQNGVITPLARLIAPPSRPPQLSADELDIMLGMSQKSGIIDREEQHLLQHVLELGQIKVRDVMVPRVDIHGHNLEDAVQDIMRLARETRLRYLPVYKGSLDLIQGIAPTRALLLDPPADNTALQKLLRPARFTPEVAQADELLADMRDQGFTFSIVVDEYGGTAGLVTLEDVVEHFIGDIPGAYERDGQAVVELIRKGVYRVGADLAVHDWGEWFGRNRALTKAAAGATTIGGVVLGVLGRMPAEGDRVSLGNIVLTVDAVEGRRITSVMVALEDAGPAHSVANGEPDDE